MSPNKKAVPLYFIIGIKLIKGILLLLLGFGIYKLAKYDLLQMYENFLVWLNLDPGLRFFENIANWLAGITPANIKAVAIGASLYSGFSFLEGFGLWGRFSWAGWLAIGESGFFVPIEVYHLIRNFSAGVLVLLILNLLIIYYLIENRKTLFNHHKSKHSIQTHPVTINR